VLLAAQNPIKSNTGMMKRAHAIAQGKTMVGKKKYFLCKDTGSKVEHVSFDSGKLRDANGVWWWWTPNWTADQGRYPTNPPAPEYVVQWDPSGCEFYAEKDIKLYADYADPVPH